MARVARVARYPVKALDGETVESVRITSSGTLAGDREYALFAADGEPVNGKRTPRVHDLDAAVEGGELTVDPATGDVRTFDLESERAAAEAWLGDFFDEDVTLRRDPEGFVDRRDAGPSVVSTATLEAVADWYDDVTVQGARERMRANVEVAGVPAFWEDRFVGADAPAFTVGGVRFEGVEPCGRCVVPERDPETGERTPSFRERFVERREATLPDWVDEEAFDHYYALMLIADVPSADRGERIAVGDSLEVVPR